MGGGKDEETGSGVFSFALLMLIVFRAHDGCT